MKSDNKLLKFTTFVLLITIVAICLVSGTFAKYTSYVSGSDTAIVAKWVVSDGDAFSSFDIFDVSKIYDTNNADYTAGTPDEEDVRTGTSAGIIAPGTWGKFSYTLTNDSDVNAMYAVEYTIDEDGVYLQWSTDGTNWTDNLDNIVADETNTKIAMDGEKTNTIYWKWAYEADTKAAGQSDEKDTELGTVEEANLAKPSISVKVTFTQID